MKRISLSKTQKSKLQYKLYTTEKEIIDIKSAKI